MARHMSVHVGSTQAGPIDPATPAGVQPEGATGYSLVFSDEFAAGYLNRAKWDPWYPDTAYWNDPSQGTAGHLSNTNEPQVYDPSGISFAGSIMYLTMRNESTFTGYPFTSGMVSSYPSFNPLYGRFEARIKTPVTGGGWCAFWMDRFDQQWPPEIDWMEHYSDGADVSHTYHPAAGPSPSPNFTTNMWPPDVGGTTPYDAFHTYGGEWRSDHITWYVDGIARGTYSGADVADSASSGMYLICNLAGIPWSYPSGADMPFSVEVDYIRAWA